jgi:transposase
MADKPVVDDGWRIPDELWKQIEPLLPPKNPQPKGGRPWTADRQAMDGIFYVLRTGCQWKALPRAIGAGSTVHDRFQQWVEAGVFRRLWEAGLLEYDALKGLDWEWQAMDGAMTKAPLGGKRNRSQSHRPGQKRHEAEPAD